MDKNIVWLDYDSAAKYIHKCNKKKQKIKQAQANQITDQPPTKKKRKKNLHSEIYTSSILYIRYIKYNLETAFFFTIG